MESKSVVIDGKTRTCGLIGNPIEHTLSPLIHNTLSKHLGQNMVYVPFCVEKDQVERAVAGAYALKLSGLNVTVPYKSRVIDSLVAVDKLAADIGAVNTLVQAEGGYKGYNTDMEGLYRALLSEKIQITGEEIILLGAGGAARAVAFLCANKGAKKVYLLNRSLGTAQRVAEEVNKTLHTTCVEAMGLSEYEKLPDRRFLAIQGTSVGLFPDVNSAVIEDAAFYQRIHTGFDLVYKPGNTKFMKLVRANGGRAYNGLKMLLYQGIIAYELWNDLIVPEEEAQLVYEELKKKTECQ